ncbi:MAG TPA: peptidylprolyl isomerase [Pseudonocardiaceae bacterium]|jgi:cyclophilin family peptidyl-prolyl cis-trans isomerase|nr:peptidylprolyl isomerase [Pseudonocardiaceae bacterium]
MKPNLMAAGALSAAVLVVLLAGCGGSTSGAPSAGGAAVPTTTAAPPPTSGTANCDFTAIPDQPAPAGHDEGLPPNTAPRAGTVMITLHTSQGDIPVTMPRAAAPCTVASFAYLAGKGYFNNSPCHRLTSADSLKVLQCGDPTGTGTGGPGYTIPDENPTNLPKAPSGQGSLYGRGLVAMANTGDPHSGGSQFFLVYGDSALPATYAVFGTVSVAGLQVLDRIAAAGLASTDQNPEDGAPALPVTITSTTLAGN